MGKSEMRSRQAPRWLSRRPALAALILFVVLVFSASWGTASAQSMPEIDLECPCAYDIQGSVVALSAERVTFSGTGRSGTLKLKLWATTSPYGGGLDITGYLLAEARLGELDANAYFDSPSHNVPYRGDLPPGTYYLVLVVTEHDAGEDLIVDHASFDGTVALGSVSGADSFTAGSVLRGAAGRAEGSTAGAGKEVGEPDHHGNPGGASLWWSWTAPATGEATIDTEGSDFDTLLAVYTGSSVGALVGVASNDDAIGRQSRVSFAARQGVVYHIVVDGYGGATGSVVLNWSQAGASVMPCDPDLVCGAAITCVDGFEYPTTCGPANCDLPIGACVTAEPVAAGSGADSFAAGSVLRGAAGRAEGSSAGAGKEVGEPDHHGNPGGASLWWSWTAPATGEATIDTEGSDFDTLLAVYTGSSVGALVGVASNDDAIGRQSRVSFAARQGVVYHIVVDGYGGATGSVVLNWSQAGASVMPCDPDLVCGAAITCVDGFEYPTTCGPANCDLPIGACVTAEPVAAGSGADSFTAGSVLRGAAGRAEGSSAGAGKEVGEPDHHGNPGGASLWWSWTAPAAGEATIDTAGSDFDTLLAVYTGSRVGALVVVASNDDAIGRQSRVSFAARQGVVYHIVVDGYGGATGSVVLNWENNPDN